MPISKTTQYTTDPNSIPVSISTGEQTLDDALEQRLTVSATTPSETFAYQRWWDTSVDQLKERSGDNLSWRTIAEVVSGELVPYSSGESAESRFAKLAFANNFSAMPSVGGDALIKEMNTLGSSGYTWQDLTASRSAGVTYTNSTGRPIYIYVNTSGTANVSSTVDGINVVNHNLKGDLIATIPDGSTYMLGGGVTFYGWRELR